MKKIFLYGIVLLLLADSITGCGNENRKKIEYNQKEKTFILGDTTFNAENGESDIDPHNENSGWACIRYGIGETLVRFTDDMEIEPWLAKSYKNIDEHTWEITLRDGITFTSGREMDAKSVQECLYDLVKKQDRAAGDLQIDTIAIENQTLTIKTKVPVPAFMNYLADPYGCIYDIRAGVTKEGIVQATGPYKAVSITADVGMDLVKNSDYWNGEPKLDRITIKTITDGDTLTMALQSGEIDAAYGMPYANYPLFQNDHYIFSGCATSRVFFGMMNFESKITSDPAVRKAIAMGIAKEGFVNALLDGNGYVAEGPYPDSFSFGGSVVDSEDYDPKGAETILEKAGWIDTDGDGIREKDGRPLILRWLTYPSRQELPLLAECAQATLGEIGFQVEINSTPDHNNIRKDVDEWDIYVSAFVAAPTGDPEYFFNYYCLDRSDHNDGHYHSEILEKLSSQMSKTFDANQRTKLAIRMQQIILDDNAYVFCSHLRMNIIAREEIKGLEAHPCDYYEITVDLDVDKE